MIDFMAGEAHFLDHLLPIWRALPESARGAIYIDNGPTMMEAVAGLDLPLVPIYLGPRAPAPADLSAAPILTASYGDIKKVRRLGRTKIAFIEHGIGQSYLGIRNRRAEQSGSYAGGPDRQDVSLTLVPNEHAAARFRARYPRHRIEVVGSPHADAAPAREPGPGPVIAVSFHWNCHIADETIPAIGHYRNALPGVAARWPLLGHSHPRGWAGMERVYRRLGIEPVRHFDEVCRRADLYICDNSSSLYEFAATGRPVVVLNAPHYRRHVHHGLRFWEAADVGVQVDQPGHLVAAIDRALALRPEDVAARERALSIVYTHRGDAARRSVAALLDWAGIIEAAA